MSNFLMFKFRADFASAARPLTGSRSSPEFHDPLSDQLTPSVCVGLRPVWLHLVMNAAGP